MALGVLAAAAPARAAPPGGEQLVLPARTGGALAPPVRLAAGGRSDACGCCTGTPLTPYGRFLHAIRQCERVRHQVVRVERAGAPAHEAVRGQALLRLAPGVEPAAFARARGLELVRAVAALRACVVARPGADPAALAGELAAAPEVEHASPNWVARTLATVPNDDMYHAQRARRALGLEDAWDITRGAGVQLAVLDTGIDAGHADLQGALAAGGWHDVLAGSPQPYDDNGHGTALAGIIAARFQNLFGTAGVAPEASLLAIKVADAAGAASFGDLIAGLDEATRRGVPIIVIALGAPLGDPLLEAALKRALDAGALVLAAAGNENLEVPLYPAAYPGVLAVGGSAGSGAAEPAFVTCLGPAVALLAPAEDVLTTLPGNVWGFAGGSSAAVAHAAGIAALALAQSPGLDRARLSQVLRYGSEPVPALDGLEEVYPARRVHALRALERAQPGHIDVAVDGLWVAPARPAPGGAARVRARVRNEGNAALGTVTLRARYLDGGRSVEIGVVQLAGLQIGEQREVSFSWRQTPPAGSYPVEVAADPVPGETELGDNVRQRAVTIAAGALPDVRLAFLQVRPDLDRGRVEVEAWVRNLGPAALADVDVSFVANGQPWTVIRIPQLEVGGEARLLALWPLPQVVPELVAFEARVARQPGELSVFDNAGEARARLGTPATRPLQALYQQSNGVDLILDAPYRLGPQRPYLPVLVFCPSKADRSTSTYVTIERARLWYRDAPSPSGGSPGTLLYEDTHGAPPAHAAPGLELLDEDGALLVRGGAPSLDLFNDEELRLNGRYNLLRLPRAALGVAGPPPSALTRYLEGRLEWAFHRRLLWVFRITRHGSHRKVLSVVFGPTDLPRLPGEGQYYDAHLHTIAEWHHNSPLQLTAPRKNYGGPLPMLNEAAAAIGFVPDPSQVKDRVAITDHNTFYNTSVGDPNHPDVRPPFGPTSPLRSAAPGGGVFSEFERYRQIYGLSAGEEVAFKQLQHNGFAGFGVDLPLGSHLLLYRAQHIEGPWHGGGFFPDPQAPPIDVELDTLLRDLAQTQPAANAHAFAFAAHPDSGMLGWADDKWRLALGLDPALRTMAHVHPNPPGFVFKGLQVWNGRGHRALAPSGIDFDDLNPFADPVWQHGNQDWDRPVATNLVAWHRAIAANLRYSFVHLPELVFVRKVLGVAGSDAHGDFNYSVSRLATPIPFNFTFSVDSSWFGCARTYVFTQGIALADAGERLVRALAGGRSVLTDGPLLAFTIDAEGRFDSSDLRWHDQLDQAADDDGLMGGHGAFDGGGTVLVVRDNPHVHLRYRYEELPEAGSNGGRIEAIHIYKDEPHAPNPTRSRGRFEQPLSVGKLAPAGPGQWLSERLDPAEEGLVREPSAFSLGAFTGGDPDTVVLGIEERRCYTNPIWALPVAVSVQASPAQSELPPGALRIVLEFPVSMDPTGGVVEVKELDANGQSSGRADPPLATLQATWSSAGGVRDARLELTNPQSIPTTGPEYPAPGRKSFVVYFREPPRDAFGNALNPLAFTFEVAWGGPGGSTASPQSGRRGGGSGGGCALGRDAGASARGTALKTAQAAWWPLVLALLALVSLRRRRGRA